MVAVALAIGVTPVVLGTGPVATAAPAARLVLGAEDNRLIAYDPASGRSAVALGSAADDPDHGLDLNGQICADPAHPGWFIAGEDTNQTGGVAEDAPGWGYLHLTGTSLDDLDVTMHANLVPTYVTQADNPENYGCGFLSDGRLVTTDVGDQQPQAPATGQLIVWFPSAGGGFAGTNVPYCKVDVGIATAGGLAVDGQDRVLVAANRPGVTATDVALGGVYRYEGLPTAPSQCTRRDVTGAPLVDAGRVDEDPLHHRRPARGAHPERRGGGAGRRVVGLERAHRRHRRVRRERIVRAAGARRPGAERHPALSGRHALRPRRR